MSSTPTPQEPLLHIKSAARKLPVKRKENPSSPVPVKPEPRDEGTHPIPAPASFSIIVDDGDVGPALDSHSDSGSDSDDAGALVDIDVGGSAVPFKFHRIWSEADEVRFLQGLLACRSQGLVFPRDLNIFFDRFSDTMTQPYTRSQLSEKLRRLRKKFRTASSRVARGLDPNCDLSPHDRELFHLSTQLWHPSYADSSPFVASGPDASKRRRRLPPPPNNNPTSNAAIYPRSLTVGPIIQTPLLALPLPTALSTVEVDKISADTKAEIPPLQKESDDTVGVSSLRDMVIKAALDVLDSSVEEVVLALRQNCTSSGSRTDLEKQWQEQRAAELDVLARRLRLVIENAVKQ